MNLESNEIKSKNALENDLNKKDSLNIQKNIDENNNIIINEQKEINKENEKIKENENRNIINRIKLNKFCIYFCFLFVRKQRNIKNILLDEGMKIVSEKLDILYLFRVLYNDEQLLEKFVK